MSTMERSQALGITPNQDDPVKAEVVGYPKQIRDIQTFLANLRHASYAALGLFMQVDVGFYEIEAIASHLLSSVFAKVEYIENRHWKQIVMFVMKPLIVNCPIEAIERVLNPILPSFFSYIRQKLDTEWKALSDKGYVMSEEAYLQHLNFDLILVIRMILAGWRTFLMTY